MDPTEAGHLSCDEKEITKENIYPVVKESWKRVPTGKYIFGDEDKGLVQYKHDFIWVEDIPI